MTKTKSTKRALLLSALSLLMCVSMLIGSTFAWFTDSATSGNNKIVAGTLDVDLLMAGENGKYASIAGEDAAIFGANSLVAQNNAADTLWEPGKTQIVYLGVENKGNLDLKYNIALNVIDGGLIGSLEYAIVDGAKYGALDSYTDWATLKADAHTGDIVAGTTVAAPNGAIKAGEDAVDYFALAVHMKEEAGNQYQGKDITIDVTVLATQLASESDSFGNDYDANANVFNVNNAAEAQAALDAAEDGAVINLTAAVNYGDLLIRVNEDSELVDYYYVMSSSDTNYYGQAVWQYAKRTINNLTITGVEGAIIDSLTTSDARDDDGNAKGTRNNMFEINNLTISNITVNNTIYFNVSDEPVGTSATETTHVPHIKLNGLTIDNCKTTTGGDMASKPGRKLLGIANTGSVSNAKNITVTNCTVTDMYQGVYIVDGENVRVEYNTFTNLTHNAIHINSFCSGNIVVANNTIANVAERAIRFNGVKSGNVTIKDNTITNSGDAAGELFKASAMGVDVTWENNTFDGDTIKLSTVGSDIVGKKAE